MDASPGGYFFVYFRLDSGPPGLLPAKRMTKVASCNLSFAHVWRSALRTSVLCFPVAAQYPSRTARSSSCSHSHRISRISRSLSVLRLGENVRPLKLEVHQTCFWYFVCSTPLRHSASGYAKNLGNLRRTSKRINDLVCIHARNLSDLRHLLQAI